MPGRSGIYNFLLLPNIKKKYCQKHKLTLRAQKPFHTLTFHMVDALREALSVVGIWLFYLVAKQPKRRVRTLTNCALLPLHLLTLPLTLTLNPKLREMPARERT